MGKGRNAKRNSNVDSDLSWLPQSHLKIFKGKVIDILLLTSLESRKITVTVPCKKTGLFGVFHTKYIHTTRVENHLKVMLNPPIFSQMLVLMWEAYQ